MNSSSDVVLSKIKWESIYKSAKIREFENDPTIKSYKTFLDKYKEHIKKGVFLDLGCGIAYVSALLAKEGVQIIGIDVSGEAISKSRTLFDKNKLKGKFIQADFMNLPLENDSVDFIYSCMSLEYVKNTQGAINEAFRVLKRDGRMIAIVPVISLTTLTYHQLRGDIPNIPLIKSVIEFIHINALKGKYMRYGYEQSFTKRGFTRLFEKAGFKIIKTDFFDMYYPIAFIPGPLRPFLKSILKYRPFWPLMYVETEK